MKNKLRKIILNGFQYLYIVTDQYHSNTETNTLTIKVFLEGHKKTPLILDFLTIDHPYAGQQLKSGVALINKLSNTTEIVNLNEPKLIRQLILKGLQNGWTGIDLLEKQDGLLYLSAMGYEIEILKPNRNHEQL
ncbi:hypothetical protein [Flavobacterium hungaricum]|uniref:Uncharacterized protein n=1 Tax=Flavobacterium hungaricum TaxID=2082725 RepID=A0ABR9TQG9_9FLAO|nr:hypothetical protein [Flavobacterium hungaricum]MBE8727616.1 hypothetical protein [Flavobacterium hungaricum]